MLPIEEIAKWEPSREDFNLGGDLMTIENHRYGNTMFLFSDLVYSILSRTEKFASHQKVYHELFECGFIEPASFLRNKEFEKILKKYGNHTFRKKTILNAAEVWDSLNVKEKLKSDSSRSEGKELRQELVEKISGVGLKLASLTLRMWNYEDIAPIDSTALKFLESRGYVFQKPLASGKPQGLKPKKYLLAESKLEEISKDYKVSLALMQATIYVKLSTWLKDSKFYEL